MCGQFVLPANFEHSSLRKRFRAVGLLQGMSVTKMSQRIEAEREGRKLGEVGGYFYVNLYSR